MSDNKDAAPPPAQRGWTRAEDYLDMSRLWRRSASRTRKLMQPRTEPEQPRFTMGALPFLLVMVVLAFMAVSIMLAAVPGKRHAQPPAAEQQRGTAPPGWLNR